MIFGAPLRLSQLIYLGSGYPPQDAENGQTPQELPRNATSPTARGVNATANAFLHDQDPQRTSGLHG